MKFLQRLRSLLPSRWHRLKAAHLRLGQKGEDIAAESLQERGMELLCRNFRNRHGELDLVLRDGCELVIAEVKTRRRMRHGTPADAVDSAKRRMVIKTAAAYTRTIGFPRLKRRYDIVEVVFDGTRLATVTHWPNAFRE